MSEGQRKKFNVTQSSCAEPLNQSQRKNTTTAYFSLSLPLPLPLPLPHTINSSHRRNKETRIVVNDEWNHRTSVPSILFGEKVLRYHRILKEDTSHLYNMIACSNRGDRNENYESCYASSSTSPELKDGPYWNGGSCTPVWSSGSKRNETFRRDAMSAGGRLDIDIA